MQWDRENVALYGDRDGKKPKKAPAKRKQKTTTVHSADVCFPGTTGWDAIPRQITMQPDMWVSGIQSELWKIAKMGISGAALKRNTIEFKYCPWQAFYAQIRSLLEQGGKQIEIRTNPGVWKKRSFTETNVSAIEGFCNFANFNKAAGYLNARESRRKQSEAFYNVIVRVEAVHTEKLKGDMHQHVVYTITVATLNPRATTLFPTDFERTQSNIDLLRRYLHSFPIRMHRDGYEVDARLTETCRQISKQHKRAKGKTSSSSQVVCEEA